jgi:hypothetical protein
MSITGMANANGQHPSESSNSAPPARWYASIYPGPRSPEGLPPGFVEAVQQLEAELQLPVWLLIQDAPLERDQYGKDTVHLIGDALTERFLAARHNSLPKGQRIALLIDSPGGFTRNAYELAMLLRRHCGGFVAVVPRHAKSAATLLALGADAIILNDHAELGPLDVQIWDSQREDMLSGLDEVQSLERLNAFAMQALDNLMLLLLDRTKMKARSLIPLASNFVARMTRPMFEKVDVVRFAQMSRALKIAEEYAYRLLASRYGPENAQRISRTLVQDYPEHGFPIYREEMQAIGLETVAVPDALRSILEVITLYLAKVTYIGKMMLDTMENYTNEPPG